VISTGLATKVKQWLGNTNMFAQSKLRLNYRIGPPTSDRGRVKFTGAGYVLAKGGRE